jgi:hypothetical protein
MLLYVAAVKTVWQTDDAETEYLRLITVGCIFSVFDAVLRMQALPAPTHLSAVYAGRAGEGPYGKKQLQFAISLRDVLSRIATHVFWRRRSAEVQLGRNLALQFAQASTLARALDNSTLVSFPPMLTTRCRLIEYLTWLESPSFQEGFQTVPLFDWTNGEDKVFQDEFYGHQTG